jgi:hypothetical protein
VYSSQPLPLLRLLCLTKNTSWLCRFQEMLGVMRAAMPRTHIVIQGLYPRGADFDANKYVWPNNYTYALSLLNSHYEVRVRAGIWRGVEAGMCGN